MKKRISTMTEAQAKEALTILGVDLRGSFGSPESPFGNFTASRNQYGPYFRRRVVPRDPKTPGQLAQRSAFAAVSPLWASLLTKEGRASWENARMKKKSRLHDRVALSGQGAWMFVNAIRQRIGLTLVLLPPTGRDAVTFTMPAARLSAVEKTLTLRFAADTWNAPGGGILVSGSPPLPPTLYSHHRFQTIIGLVHPGTAEWIVEYPSAVEEGDRVRLRFHVSAPTGRQGMAVEQDVIAE